MGYNNNMAINFITGAPGSGKTAVTGEMSARGYNIYDTDDPNHTGMAGWHNLTSGDYVAGFNELPVTDDLLANHTWRLTNKAFNDFRQRGTTENIYLCGRIRDAKSVIEASRHIVFLTVLGETIEERIAIRSEMPGVVEWGREPWQVKRSIEVNKVIEEEYRNIGAIMIDANQPLVDVVNDIITKTNQE